MPLDTHCEQEFNNSQSENANLFFPRISRHASFLKLKTPEGKLQTANVVATKELSERMEKSLSADIPAHTEDLSLAQWPLPNVL